MFLYSLFQVYKNEMHTHFFFSFLSSALISLSLSILFQASYRMLFANSLSNMKLRVGSSFIFSKSMRYII